MQYLNNSPLVSVLMTSYNQENYIGFAIESVIASTYTNFELIIVDDCSTDKTCEVILKYQTKDKRIKFYKNQFNIGDYPNRNKAASHANGKYIKYLDADDIIYEHGLEVMVRSMEMFPEAGLGISLYEIELNIPYPFQMSPKEIFRKEYLSTSLLGLGPSAAIIKNKNFIEVGGFSGERYIGDTELWLRLSLKFPIVVFNPSLNWYRRHDKQQIQNERKDIRIRIVRLDLKRKYLIESRTYFSDMEFKFAGERINQHFARILLKEFFSKMDYKTMFYLLRMSNIGLLGLLKGFKKYT